MGSGNPGWSGGAFGLAAAALFGASAPLAKVLLPGTGPLLLSALLYLGAAAALFLYTLLQPRSREAQLTRADMRLMISLILFGGVLGPILLLTGLQRVSGLTGSLMLNLEAPLTIVVAVIAFGDHLGWGETIAASAIVLSAALLAYGPGALRSDWVGVAAIAGACLSWAIDNNLSQLLSLKDPIAVVRLKALGAGAGTLLLALCSGKSLPGPSILTAALALGGLSYGLSLVFDMKAFRLVGAAREAAYFATAPFFGAALSILVFRQLPAFSEIVAASIMAIGVVVLIREDHGHVHQHQEMEHDHLHVHDAHHQHAHDAVASSPHSHPHRHAGLTHDHAHLPDSHHRHTHR
jgi:drug/metabolite transporter (DMT)-like permease